MDFLLKYQHRIQRLVYQGLSSFGYNIDPIRLVVDLRSNTDLASSIFEEIVHHLNSQPSSYIVLLVDKSSRHESVISLLRFVHRLDCAIVIRSYDCILDVPSAQVRRYIYCITDQNDWDSKKYIHPKFCVEVEYNRNTVHHLHTIFSSYAEAFETHLVLPESADKLPENDKVLEHWSPQKNQTRSPSFMKDLERLRKEGHAHPGGIGSSVSIQIPNLSKVIEGEQSVFDHSSTYLEAELRLPTLREWSYFSKKITRKMK